MFALAQKVLVATEAELEQRARSGDPRAQFALGRLLLDGPRGAVDGDRGVALIEQASTAGDSDATAMLALFHAMGIGRAPNWERALDRLQLAAEQGSASARSQLQVLAPEVARREGLACSGADDWGELRRAIDLSSALRTRPPRSLSERPRVRVIERFASRAECRWLIGRARERLRAASVITETGATGYNLARSNSSAEFQVTDMDLVIELIRVRIFAATRLPPPSFEPTQVLHYAAGQEFRPHVDFMDPANPGHREELRKGQRIATFLIYLNDGFTGGETEFLDAKLKFKGGAGDAIFWANVGDDGQPDPLTRHAGLPAASGEKWILSQWIRGRGGEAR